MSPSAGRETAPSSRRHRAAFAGLATATAMAMALCGSALAAEPVASFVVQEGDTLIDLSNEVFISPQAWREIARLNKLPDADLIRPGQQLRVPLRLLRGNAVDGQLLSSVGEVKLDGAAVAAGSAVRPGQRLSTAANASAVLRLADGSRLRVLPNSEIELAQSIDYAKRADQPQGLFAGLMRLVRGSLEVVAAKVLRAKPLEVESPTAVIGVRGTEFRVRQESVSGLRAEVLEGIVGATPARRDSGVAVAAGNGTAIVDPRVPPFVAKLLPALDLGAMPQVFERPILRFTPPANGNAVRVQVASDEQFDAVVRDELFAPNSQVRIAGLDDGRWWLRVRAVDRDGIEGLDAKRAVRLEARPEPPAPTRPRADGKAGAGALRLAWLENTTAAAYRVQVAKDAAFTQPVFEAERVQGDGVAVPLEEAGDYHWRVASIAADASAERPQGPWSDAQRFTLRPRPAQPSGSVEAEGKTLQLRFSGRAGDRQQVQLARDTGFADVVAEAELERAEWTLDKPETPGTYYFRFRSIEPDGFVGPYSSALKIEVPRDWSGAWRVLLPMLLVL